MLAGIGMGGAVRMKTSVLPAWKNRIVEYDLVPGDQLLAHPKNFRVHPKNQQDALADILDSVGWVQNVLVNKRTGFVVDGHLRAALAISRGESVPVAYIDVSEDEEALILATIDPIAALAGTDMAQLDTLLRDVHSDNQAVQEMLAGLAEGAGLDYGAPVPAKDDPGAAIDRAAELRERWGTERGQLWQIGRHRLLCGDSTNAEDVARLMDGARATLVFADPPYGISIVATNGFVGGGEAYDIPFGGVKNRRLGSTDAAKPFGSKAQHRGSIGAANIVDAGKYLPVKGDETTETAVNGYRLAAELFPDAVHVWWGGNYYADALPPSSCWLVWDKQNTGNFADAELAWTNQKRAVRLFRHQWNGMLRESERRRRLHPTQKPVALAVWAYETLGSDGDVVFDPFLGAGMSMVAAEQTGRDCYGIEYEADYIAVILERMVGMGLTPQRVD